MAAKSGPHGNDGKERTLSLEIYKGSHRCLNPSSQNLATTLLWASKSEVPPGVLDWISEAEFGLKSVSRTFHLRPLMYSLCSTLFNSSFFFFFSPAKLEMSSFS